jgi:hypothetical protein
VTALIPLLFLGIVLAPFFIAGLRRQWRIAAVFAAIFVGYALLVWSSSVPPEEVHMAPLWRMIVTVVATGSIVAFVLGFALSTARAPRADFPRRAVK